MVGGGGRIKLVLQAPNLTLSYSSSAVHNIKLAVRTSKFWSFEVVFSNSISPIANFQNFVETRNFS